MWRLKILRHKATKSVQDLEDFKLKRREFEKALRQARRDRQLISKRLLVNEEDRDVVMETDSAPLTPDQIREMVHSVRCGGEQKAANLVKLRRTLQDPQTHLIFNKLENSIHVLVGLLSGSNGHCQLEALRCLHELSHSPHPGVGQSCLPATPYLLTYLSSQSTKLTELSLYTLGNMWPDSALVREKLLAQGIVPALANCIQNQKCNLAVVEAVGFTVSQMLQHKDSTEKVIQMIIATNLLPHLMSHLSPDPEFGLGAAIECAWSLHYIISSNADSSTVSAEGLISHCSNLLIILAEAIAKKSLVEGLELLIWPLLRCLGNLLASGVCEAAGCSVGEKDVRLLAALCVFSQNYLTSHCALSRESLWVLNNLTAGSSTICSLMLFCKIVPTLIQLLPYSSGVNIMVLRILGNIAHNGSGFCDPLIQTGILPALCVTLKMAESEVVLLSLEILHLLICGSPKTVDEFIQLNGVHLLEAIQFNNQEEHRFRATYILDHYLHTQ